MEPHFSLLLIISIAWMPACQCTLPEELAAHLFQDFSTSLHNTICNLNSWHTARISRARISIRDIGNILQRQLSCIEDARQSLPISHVSADHNQVAIRHALSDLTAFIACFTITLVSNNSTSMRPRSPLRTCGFVYMMPFGATNVTVHKITYPN